MTKPKTFAESKFPIPLANLDVSLTHREEDVIRRVAAGRTNPEIANDLHLGLSTVKTHLGSIASKLSARNRVEIAIWAYQHGKVDAEDSR